MNDKALIVANGQDIALVPFNVGDVVRQKELVQQVMKAVMKKDEHYGVIPGTDKPTLYKPGAEILKFIFRLAAHYEVVQTDLPGGHREYRVTAIIQDIRGGNVVAEGVGMCSTMESKYRFRRGDAEDTGKPIPGAYWDAKKANQIAKTQELLGGKGLVAKKNKDGAWTIHKRSDELVENPNIADTYNTCLKIGKKRADVDGTISATAASDIFAQDLEDLEANAQVYQPSAVMEDDIPHVADLKAPATMAKLVESPDARVPIGAGVSSAENPVAFVKAAQTSAPAAPPNQPFVNPACPFCGAGNTYVIRSYVRNTKTFKEPPEFVCWKNEAKGKNGCGKSWTPTATADGPSAFEKAIDMLELVDITSDRGPADLKAVWESKALLNFYEACSAEDQAKIIAKHEELKEIG